MSDDPGQLERRRGSPAEFPTTPARSAMPGWYEALLESVATRIEGGQQRAIAAANQELLLAYWGVGRDILDRQHEQGGAGG